MRSYGLGIGFCMLLAALFAYQNPGDLVIRFLVWERVLPQGVWEIALFTAGAIAMWFISLSAILETRNKNARELKEQKERITILEEDLEKVRDERNALMLAMKKYGADLPLEMLESGKDKWSQDIQDFCTQSDDYQEDDLSGETCGEVASDDTGEAYSELEDTAHSLEEQEQDQESENENNSEKESLM